MFKWRAKHKKLLALPVLGALITLMFLYNMETDDFDFDEFYRSDPMLLKMTYPPGRTTMVSSATFQFKVNESLKYRKVQFLDRVLKWYNYSDDSLNGPKVSMTDQKVVQKLRDNFLIPPPSSADHQYRLARPRNKDPSMGQAEKVRSILHEKRNGFFIEVGALDGETRSNTLYFERFLNWTGLLIEPDPLNFADLLRKNRRAWISPSCVSIHSYPEIVKFEQNENMGKIVDTGVNDNKSKIPKGVVNVQCFPLYTYLLALNVTQVDYFSLDVEGVELDVLKTIPFNLINIQTLSVEFAHVPGGKSALHDYMFEQGYVMHSEVTHPDWLANDFIFMKVD